MGPRLRSGSRPRFGTPSSQRSRTTRPKRTPKPNKRPKQNQAHPGAEQAPLTSEHQLVDQDGQVSEFYKQEIIGHFDTAQQGNFKGVGGIDIAYRVFPTPNEKGAIVIVNGRAEQMVKNAELVYDLRSSGYSVYMLDHRGQGESGRMLEESTKGYVDEFQYYVDDLKTFVDTVVRQAPHPKVFALAHSMGGAITTLYAEQHPGDFDAIVLSSPMLQIKEERDSPINDTFGKVTVGLGMGKWNAPAGEKPLTSSGPRNAVRNWIEDKYPSTVIKAPTFRWADQAFTKTREARANAGQIKDPVLILQALEDKLVSVAAQNEVCETINKAGGSCKQQALVGSEHEAFNENDKIRGEAMHGTLGFFNEHAKTKTKD